MRAVRLLPRPCGRPVLDANGIHVPRSTRETILACTDLDQLKTWLRRAIKATSIEDVLGT